MIIKTTVVNEDYGIRGDNGAGFEVGGPGNNTEDYIFLMDQNEMTKYFDDYMEMGAKYNGNDDFYWLRSPLFEHSSTNFASAFANAVYAGGGLEGGPEVSREEGVRDALWLNLNP